jgi:hypothetical protein
LRRAKFILAPDVRIARRGDDAGVTADGNDARRLLLIALGTGMLGALLAWGALDTRSAFPVGVAMLGAAALLSWRVTSRWTALLAAAASLLVLSRLFGADGAGQLLGEDGSTVAIGRALQGLGALCALAVATWIGLRGRPRGHRAAAAPTESATAVASASADAVAVHGTRRDRLVVIGSLVVLSAIGAELLSAYNDTTGRPAELLFNVVFFAMLYGCPALLIRELARRTGRGWPAMLLLSAAAGLLQAGVIDQSLFSDSYGDVKGWEDSLRATYIAPLGLGGFMLQGFVVGHVVYSFCAPIALAEAMRPGLAHRSWLGRRGLAVATASWMLVAAAIVAETLGSEAHATLPEVAVTLVVIAALVVAALRVGRVDRPARERAPRLRTTLVVSFIAASAHAVAMETWLGVAVAVLVVGASAWLLARAARNRNWGLPHVAAVAAGVLLSRGALAFLYYPVVGETSAGQKYAHNVVMLLIVVAAGAYAIRRATNRGDEEPAPPRTGASRVIGLTRIV